MFGFEYDGEEREENFNGDIRVREDGDLRFVCEEVEQNGSSLRKKKRGRLWPGWESRRGLLLITSWCSMLREREARFEQCDVERESERQRGDSFRLECEQEWEWKWEEWVKKKEREKAREQLKKQKIEEWEAFEKDSEGREKKIGREEALIHEGEWEERMNRRMSEWKKRMDNFDAGIFHEQINLTSLYWDCLSVDCSSSWTV